MTDQPKPTTWFGWSLIVLGSVGVVGSVLPWIKLSGPNAAAITLFIEAKGGGLHGLDHGGAVTVVLALAAVGLGVARILGRMPRASYLGIPLGMAMAVVAVLAVIDTSLADQFRGQATALTQTAAAGVWVTLVAAVGVTFASVGALISGDVVPRPEPDQPGSTSPGSSTSTSSTDSMMPVTASTTDANEATGS